MSFKSSFHHSLKMFKLDEKAIRSLSEDKHATGWGILFIILAGIALAIGTMQVLQDMPPLIILGAPILLLISSFIGISVLYFLSEFLGGKGSFAPFYRAYSHMYFFNIVALIPFIGLILSSLVGIWQIIMAIYITKVVRKVTLTKAAIVVLIPVLVIIILAIASTLVLSLTIFGKYFLTFMQPTV